MHKRQNKTTHWCAGGVCTGWAQPAASHQEVCVMIQKTFQGLQVKKADLRIYLVIPPHTHTVRNLISTMMVLEKEKVDEDEDSVGGR